MERLKIVSKERTERLAWLAKIELTEVEKLKFTEQLNKILDSAKLLEEVDVGGIDPTFHAIEVTNDLRDDVEEDSMDRKDALSNAAKTKDGYFVAPKIV